MSYLPNVKSRHVTKGEGRRWEGMRGEQETREGDEMEESREGGREE